MLATDNAAKAIAVANDNVGVVVGSRQQYIWKRARKSSQSPLTITIGDADASGTTIAKAINAEKLAFLTDIEGVYKDYNDKSSLISELSTTEARQLLAGGTIGGGMLPKLNNCIDAIEHGVSRVHILDGRIPHCLLLEIFTNKGVGTAILSDDAEKFFDSDK